jgi:tetraacyldisaccharide 4'-kinase
MKITALLQPLSWLYSRVTSLRNELYDRALFETFDAGLPVVSIGNLTLGGTGKTPMICELVSWALENGLRPAIVSRGYRGQVQGEERVPVNGDPKRYGDEPVLMANRFSKVPVYVGADRVAAVRQLKDKENVDIVFADDAFQHRRLRRNIDVVVVDCTESLQHYRVVPVGRGREKASGLQRADFIILNKVNLATPEQKKNVLEFIENQLDGRTAHVIEAEYYVHKLINLKTGEVIEPRGFEPAVLVSGVGNPKGVERLLVKNFDIKQHLSFRDHHDFSLTDIDRALGEAQKYDAKKILVTEKDAVKIVEKIRHDDRSALRLFWRTELSLKLSLQVKKLHEKVLGLKS